MKYQKLLLGILILCLPYLSLAQEKPVQYNNEVSLNVTSLLGNLLSINDNGSGSPYGLSYRRYGKNQGVRLSVDGSYDKSDRSNFEQFILSETLNLNVRVGYERIKSLSDKMNLLYGIDLIGIYETEDSEITDFDFNTGQVFEFTQQDEIIKYGGGPSLKFQYVLNPRVSLFTESNLYFVTGTDKTTSSDISIPSSDTKVYNISLMMPVALFVSFAF